MGEALALLALLLFSTNVLVVKVATPRLALDVGFLLALGSNVVFAALLFVGERFVRPDAFVVEWVPLLGFAIGGLFTTYVGRRQFFRSVQTIGPSRASALQITNPVFAALVGWIVLGESLGWTGALFGLLVLGGLYLTTRTSARAPVPVANGELTAADAVLAPTAVPRREIAIALLGAMSYGIGNVIRSAAVREWDQAVFGGFLGAACAIVVYLVMHTDLRQLAARLREAPRSGICLWTLSGVLTISAQIALIASTRTIPVAVGVVIAAAIPLLVVPFSIVFFRNTEGVTIRTVCGILLIFGGVAGLVLTA